jgi:hypothetical protein
VFVASLLLRSVGLIRGKVSQLQMAAGGWLDKIKRFIPLVYVLLRPFPADGSAQLLRNFPVKWRTSARLLHVHIFYYLCAPKSLGDFLLAHPDREGGGEHGGLFDYNTKKHTKKLAFAVSFECD